MNTDPQRPANANADEEQLRVLSVCYFAYGGLAGAFSLMGLAMLFAGTIIGTHGAAWGAWGGRPEEQVGAAIVGCIFAAVGSGLFLLLGVTALLRILVGVTAITSSAWSPPASPASRSPSAPRSASPPSSSSCGPPRSGCSAGKRPNLTGI
jgi:hypothetical protein